MSKKPLSTNTGFKPHLDFRGLKVEQKGDNFIIEKGDDPNAIPMHSAELVERLSDALGDRGASIGDREAHHVASLHDDFKSSVPLFGKPSGAPGAPSHFDSAFDNIRTMRPARPDHNVARMLLKNAAKPRVIGLDEVVDISSGKERFQVIPKHDDRPLIDLLHEATFNNDAPGLTYIKDKYALRMILRKAHCFTLDAVTSALVSDFSVAIARDLESARRMAIPPFPVTWIDINNPARLNRMVELGYTLTPRAAGEAEGGVVERVGWLIHPGDRGGFFASYCCLTDHGATMAPLSWWWHAGSPGNPERDPERDAYIQGLTFGIRDVNVGPTDAYPDVTPLHYTLEETKRDKNHVRDLMQEISGELRHIWGLLIALGAGQLGMEAKYSVQAKPERPPPVMKNGKPLLPLEHKVLHLHLAKRMTPDRVMVRMMTHHKLRWHEVRAHFRTLRNDDGTVRARVPVKSHERGDEKLGRVEKTYKVER